jgi:hypothetical protein
MQCSGTVKATGKRCRSNAQHGKDVCIAHDQEAIESGRFGGAQPGAGRPPRPKVVEIWRAKVEAEADKWFSVLTDAREAERAVVTWDGERNQITMVADHRTRLRAFAEAMDRVFGKPIQTVDVTSRVDESEVDTEIRALLAEMDRRDGRVHANGNGKLAA